MVLAAPCAAPVVDPDSLHGRHEKARGVEDGLVALGPAEADEGVLNGVIDVIARRAVPAEATRKSAAIAGQVVGGIGP